MTLSYRVVIVGGGLGGLALAHRLLKAPYASNIQIVLLERDLSRDEAREQGYAIGLVQEGVDALLACCGSSASSWLTGLLTKDGPSDLLLLDSKGSILLHGRGWLRVRVQAETMSGLVDRAALRNALVDALPQETIQWNKKFASYETKGDKVLVLCEDGSEYEADLLVGADGAHSVVRERRCPALAPTVLPYFNIAGTVDLPVASSSDGPFVEAAKLGLTRITALNSLSLMSFAMPTRSDAQGGSTTFLWSLSMPASLAAQHGCRVADEREARDSLLKLISTSFPHRPELAEFVAATQVYYPGADMSSVSLDVLNRAPLLDSNFERDWRVVLIGDAAHKTTTQAGLGASAAFSDAFELAETIGEIVSSAKEAKYSMRAYNSALTRRARRVVQTSIGSTTTIHSDQTGFRAGMVMGLLRLFGNMMSFKYWITSFF